MHGISIDTGGNSLLCLRRKCADGVHLKVHFYRFTSPETVGKCRFGPVRSTATVDNATTLSSEFHHGYTTRSEFDISSEETDAVNVRRRQPVRAIVFMHYVRIIISLPCPRMTFTTSLLQNVVKSGYTLLSLI